MKKINYKKKGYIILGVNGWFECGHDASATLLEVTKDSCKILGALEEEKVIKRKCAYNLFPVNSIQYLLNSYNLTINDIDFISFGWNYPKMYHFAQKDFPFNNKILLKELFPNTDIKKDIPIEFIDHHLAHAACSFRTSNFKESLIFVIDGQGETESGSVWIGKDNKINLLSKIDIKESLGFLYEAVNLTLNFNSHESGKTMGLAPYGKPKYLETFKKCFDFSDTFTFNKEMLQFYEIAYRFSKRNLLDNQILLTTMWEYFIKEKLRIQRLESKIRTFYELDDNYKDLAASVQCFLEDTVINLIKNYVKKTGISYVCLSGGVALNCIMNGKILEQDFIDDLFINPAANDAGVSLGAALEMAHKLGFKSKNDEDLFSPFIGIEFSNDEVIDKLNKLGIKYKTLHYASDYLATYIERSKIVSIFQGKNEWGPRALGNRTILSLATQKKRLDYINGFIKERELGRPLGPSILIEDKGVLLNNPKSLGFYMNIAYKAQNNIEKFPAIIHVDRTFRPEFVNETYNKDYFEQLKSIKKITGDSIVINTSFNLKTPIIFFIEDAIDYFQKSNIDMLVFNNQIVLEK